MTPIVNPELGLKFVRPLIPAKSKRRPEARTCIPSRASACDSVPSGPFPGRVLARPRLIVELTFGAPFWAADQTRRQLTERCRGFIADTLGLGEPTPVAVPSVRRAA